MVDKRWNMLAYDSWKLALDASAVIWLRMGRFALCSPDAAQEWCRMVNEKIDSALTLQARTLTGRMGASQFDVTRASVRHYRRKVSANRRRLTQPR